MEQVLGQISMFDVQNYKISDTDIRQALLKGSGFSNGKNRIYDYFSKENDLKKQAEFLKNEYGVGGWTGAIPGNFYSQLDHNAKGITIDNDHKKVNLSWIEVAKIIKELVNNNLYMGSDNN